MIDRRRLLISAATAAALAGLPVRAVARTDADARLDALLERWFEENLDRSPESATNLGLDRGDKAWRASELSQRGPDDIAANRARAIAQQQELQALDLTGLSPQGEVNLAISTFRADTAANGARLPYGNASGPGRMGPYVVSQLSGAYFTVPDFLDSQHRIEGPDDVESYLSRLASFAAVVDQETARVRADAEMGVTLSAVILDKTINQIRTLRDTPADETAMVQGLTRKAAERGLPNPAGRAATIIDGDVRAALSRQLEVLDSQRAGASEDVGLWRLPHGEAFYAHGLRAYTTTGLSGAEIHAMGLDQVAEINAEIDVILRGEGMTHGTVGERVTALNTDPAQLWPNTDEGRAGLLASLNAQVEALEPLLPTVFRRLPRAGVEIRRVPVSIQTGAPGGYYQGPPLDGSRPGAYYINLRDTANWPKFALPTLTYHEASPGHHLQVALQRETESLPDWRRAGGFSAYNEGWALYAESVAANDLDAYENDPLGRVGFLMSYLFRAVRLVVDSGLHHERWSRQQAIDYMVAAGVKPPNAAQSEIDRYCVMPGQACSYKVGHTVIARLRAEAEARPGFDLRDFHDAVLRNGSMPLAVLEDLLSA